MKLSIAILTELCYTEGVQTFGFTGRFAFLNAVTNHNLFIVGKAPHVSGLTSRRTSEQLTAANMGRFVFQPQKDRKMTRRNPLKDRNLRDDMFVQGMLWCSRCRQFYPVKDFGTSPANKDRNYGYGSYCKICTGQQYQSSKETRSLYFKNRNNALKAKFVEFTGGTCQKCGYNGYMAAFDFHHVYPAQKKYLPTKVLYLGNFEKAWRELDKCCLLCRNCHSAYEAGLWRVEFIKRDGLGWTAGTDLPLDDKRYETKKPPAYNQASMPLFNYQQKNLQLDLFDSLSTTYAVGCGTNDQNNLLNRDALPFHK